MSKLGRIALHEYRRNVFKRSFLLALFSVPLMLGLSVGTGLLLESLSGDDSPVGYVDHAGLLADPVAAPLTGSRKPVEFVPFRTEQDARAALDAGDIQAYYVVAADYRRTKEVGLFYLEEPGGNATRQFYDFIQINLLAGQPPDIAHRAALIGEGVTVRSLDGRRQVSSGGPDFGVIVPLLTGFAFVFLLLMSSGYLMQAVVDEKENRTMEVVVTSVSPMQFIGGKVLAIVAISLTQLIAWTLVAVLAIVIAGRAGVEWFQDPSLDWGTLLSTVALAIPSYVLVSALMTAIGAMSASDRESQSIAVVFFLLHLCPMWLFLAFIETPNAALPMVLSFLPFTALLTIILRSIFAVVPLWQVAASVALQTLYAMGALWIASRAFRLGMLRYGQRLNLREILTGARP